MLIDDKDFYFDIERQKYVMYLHDSSEVKIVEKEYIKKCLYDEAIKKIENYDLALASFKQKYKTIFVEIESRRFIFDPFKSENFIKDKIECKNLYIPTPVYRKALELRKKTELKKLHNDIEFLEKYKHINSLFTNLFITNERKQYFINWLATALITRQKNRTAILLRGGQGTGKGVMWEHIIEYAVSSAYCGTISNDDLKTNFNSSLENKLFVLANEIKGDFREGNHLYEKLKMYVSDDALRIEQKRIDSRAVKNYFNIIIHSNNATPLQIQAGDRRYTVFETSSRKLKNVAEDDYGESIFDFIQNIKNERDDFITDLMLYNYDRDIAQQVLDTEEKERIYRASMSKADIISDKIKNLDYHFFTNDFIEICELLEEEEFFALCNKLKIININDSIEETVKEVINTFFKQVGQNESGEIENKYLIFFYTIFTGEKSSQKIGTALTKYFGNSFNRRINGSQKRCRYIKTNIDEIPF